MLRRWRRGQNIAHVRIASPAVSQISGVRNQMIHQENNIASEGIPFGEKHASIHHPHRHSSKSCPRTLLCRDGAPNFSTTSSAPYIATLILISLSRLESFTSTSRASSQSPSLSSQSSALRLAYGGICWVVMSFIKGFAFYGVNVVSVSGRLV
jgi:hypothetical protein